MTFPSNVLLADKLREMADILEVQQEDGYRITAYRRAARTLLELEKPIDEIVRNEGFKGVIELPGIGRGIGTAIVEIVTTGRWNQLDRLSGTLDPEQLFQTVPGIGPELASRIHNDLNVDTLEQLEQAAHDGRLEHVPGVGARRALGIKGALTDRLGHRHFKPPAFPRTTDRAAAGCGPGVSDEGATGPSTQDRPQALQSGRSSLATRPAYKSRRMAIHRAFFKHAKSA